MSRAGSRRSYSPGFTTLELLVVIAIMVLVGGVVVASLGPTLRSARLNSACRMVVSAMTYARSRAVTSGVTTRVVFKNKNGVEVESHPSTTSTSTSSDSETKTLSTPAGRRRSFPTGITIASVTKASGTSGEETMDEDYVEFRSLGQSETTTIELTDKDGAQKYVVVDAMTGRSKVKTKDELNEKTSSSSESE